MHSGKHQQPAFLKIFVKEGLGLGLRLGKKDKADEIVI